ncbi:MAG: hypothetical protein F4Z95_07845 [Gammaproteobacteria bacterium]|nr:hypothetical protein [Gammaproteobacteria bacterium]
MRFPIIPIDATASTVLALLAALPLAISVFVVVSGGGPARYFASQSWISLTLSVGLPVLITLLLVYFLYGGYRSSVTITGDALEFSVPVYGRSIPLDTIEPTGVRIVNMRTDGEVRLGLRTNGLGSLGYQLGWFRLVGGGKALVALTDRSSVTSLPLNDGTTVLVSLEDPAAFIGALETARGRSERTRRHSSR